MLLIVLVAYARLKFLVPDTLPQVAVTVISSLTAPGLTVTLPSLEMEILSLFSVFAVLTDQLTVGESTASSNAFLTEAVNAVSTVIAASASPGIFTEVTPPETVTLVATSSPVRDTVNIFVAVPVVSELFPVAVMVYVPAFAFVSIVISPVVAAILTPLSDPPEIDHVSLELSIRAAVSLEEYAVA